MLKIVNISKTFDKGTVREKTAIKNLSLDVHDGDFITIIGANGAGKSTLFNAISGDFIVDKGNIFLDDKDVTMLPTYKRAKKIGRLFQDPMKGTAPSMTIEENMALAGMKGSWLSSPTKEDRKKFREILSLLNNGLEDRLSQPVGLLSGGQRQSLSLLMATINKPSILLLDEHTAALDPAAADTVLNLTKKIVSENKITCLMITHNMEQALKLGNRTIMMDTGNIVYDVSGEEREKLSIQDLIKKFRENVGRDLATDRVLLS